MMNVDFREIYHALGDLIAIINRRQSATVLMREGGFSLDRALFLLLVRIERHGPIGIVELGEISDRDYTTISRQVARLEGLGLVSRRTGAADRRVREVVVTPTGLAMTDSVDGPREKIMAALLATWRPHEIREFARLSRKLIDAIAAAGPSDQFLTKEPRTPPGKATVLDASGGRAVPKANSLDPA